MPTYIYRNEQTGERIELTMSVSSMEQSERDGFIEHDGVWLKRDYEAEHGVCSKPGGCASWPMRSDACGVHPDQAGEAYRHSESLGVPTQFDQRTGQAIFTDRSHRKRYLAARGFNDRNGGYGD